jgi:hypothetical protein
LDKTLHGAFVKLCSKFESYDYGNEGSYGGTDVQCVKLVPPGDADTALYNAIKLESIEKAAEELQQQAGVFKRNARPMRMQRGLGLLTQKIDHSTATTAASSSSKEKRKGSRKVCKLSLNIWWLIDLLCAIKGGDRWRCEMGCILRKR